MLQLSLLPLLTFSAPSPSPTLQELLNPLLLFGLTPSQRRPPIRSRPTPFRIRNPISQTNTATPLIHFNPHPTPSAPPSVGLSDNISPSTTADVINSVNPIASSPESSPGSFADSVSTSVPEILTNNNPPLPTPSNSFQFEKLKFEPPVEFVGPFSDHPQFPSHPNFFSNLEESPLGTGPIASAQLTTPAEVPKDISEQPALAVLSLDDQPTYEGGSEETQEAFSSIGINDLNDVEDSAYAKEIPQKDSNDVAPNVEDVVDLRSQEPNTVGEKLPMETLLEMAVVRLKDLEKQQGERY